MKNLFWAVLIVTFWLPLHAGLTILEESPGKIVAEYTITDYSLHEINDRTVISAPELSAGGQSGSPALPYYASSFLLPPDGNAHINVLKTEAEKVMLSHAVAPVSTPVKRGKIAEEAFIVNAKLYAEKHEVVEYLGSSPWRSYNTGNFLINPFIYNHQDQSLTINKKITFAITIEGNLNLREFSQDLPEDVLNTHFINYESGRTWQRRLRDSIYYAPFALSDYWLKLEVPTDGFYAITYNDLSSLPLQDIDPQTIRLFSTSSSLLGQLLTSNGTEFAEVPLRIIGQEDGSFDEGDKIIFYGECRDGIGKNTPIKSNQYFNPYSQNTVYWLTFGGRFSSSPKRIEQAVFTQAAEKTVTTHTVVNHYEEDNVNRTNTGFQWYQRFMFANLPQTYNFSAPDIADAQNSLLTFYLYPNSSQSQRLVVKMNELPIDTLIFSGYQYRSFSQNFSNLAATNNLTFTSTGELYFDYYEIQYKMNLIKRNQQFFVNPATSDYLHTVNYRFNNSPSAVDVYEVSGFNAVKSIVPGTISGGFEFVAQPFSNVRYVVCQTGDYLRPTKFGLVNPVDLTAQNSSADCIIITPERFYEQALLIAQTHEEGYGVHSIVVKLEDVFNQFNAGMVDPEAIRLYLKYAFNKFPRPAPQYVLLFGSGTTDWRNNSGLASGKNNFPIYHKDFSISGSYFVSSDDFFVQLESSVSPEMAIGRIPAKNEADAIAAATKIQNYVLHRPLGSWRNEMLFLADDQYNGNATTELYHSVQMQQTAENISNAIMVDKMFSVEYDLDPFRNKPQVREEMIAKINEGKLVWYFIGHGAYDILGEEDYFRSSTDLPLLHNGEKLPLFIAASCEVGEYDYYGYTSLGEDLVVLPAAGSIVSVAASALSNGDNNVSLMEKFLGYAANQRKPAGLSFMLAKQVLTNLYYNNRVYIYFGDPVLQITPPERFNNAVLEQITTERVSKQNSNMLDTATVDSEKAVTAAGREEFSARMRLTYSLNMPIAVDGNAKVAIYDTEYHKKYTLPNSSSSFDYSKYSNALFRGSGRVTHGQSQGEVVVPDDIRGFDEEHPSYRGRLIAYVEDESKTPYIVYNDNLIFNGHNFIAEDNQPPTINLWLDSEVFTPGDFVSSTPTLYVQLADSSGINVLGKAGHKIILNIDNSTELTDLTPYFNYDADSAVSGSIVYQIPQLSNGNHRLVLTAFDNFNNPVVCNIDFQVSNSGESKLELKDLTVYPNPVKNTAYFSFTSNQRAEVKVEIFTFTGKKIRTIRGFQALSGFNKIYWDGRDEENDKPANNTYLYKITAKSLTNGRKTEKKGKLSVFN